MARNQLSVRLFHGRKHPDEQLDDWGFDGPCIGPVSSVHLTYLNLRIAPDDDECVDIPRVDDLLFYDGGYFGDVAIESAALQPPTSQIDERLTAAPARGPGQLRRPIVLPRRKLHEYLLRVEVFVDSIRELVGDKAAEAARVQLSHVVSER